MKAKDVRVTFEECLCACLENEVFLREFDRLTGCQLSGVPHRTPLEAMVDKATEVDESVRLDLRQQQGDVDKFIAFVYETVWLRLDPAERAPQDVRPPPGKSFEELMGS